jgi:DNA polymerase-3 subunit epsilon
MAAQLGCAVGTGVTKKTTLLVVGDQDLAKLAGHEKSSKHRKAEELIAAGAKIRILRESDFQTLCASASRDRSEAVA